MALQVSAFKFFCGCSNEYSAQQFQVVMINSYSKNYFFLSHTGFVELSISFQVSFAWKTIFKALLSQLVIYLKTLFCYQLSQILRFSFWIVTPLGWHNKIFSSEPLHKLCVLWWGRDNHHCELHYTMWMRFICRNWMAGDHDKLLINFLTSCWEVWKDYLKKKKRETAVWE